MTTDWAKHKWWPCHIWAVSAAAATVWVTVTVSVHWVKCDNTWFGMWCLQKVFDFLLQKKLHILLLAPILLSSQGGLGSSSRHDGATGKFFSFSLTAAARLYLRLFAPHLHCLRYNKDSTVRRQSGPHPVEGWRRYLSLRSLADGTERVRRTQPAEAIPLGSLFTCAWTMHGCWFWNCSHHSRSPRGVLPAREPSAFDQSDSAI